MCNFAKFSIVFCVFFAGCAEIQPAVRGVYAPSGALEVPVANLPGPLREWNWTDSQGSGSCVHASTVYQLRWQNHLELAEWWRKSHAGGETASSIRGYLDKAKVPYQFTEAADPAFLDWATKTRRGAIIWFYPSHCVHFCGFAKNEKGDEVAMLCDNNRVERFIAVPRAQFLVKWREYGGFALSVMFSPVPPPLFPGWERS
jgi:hypothetical protein